MSDQEQTGWASRYARRLAIVDLCVVIWATVGALLVRFGSSQRDTLISASGEPYVFISIALAALWWIMLSLWGSREPRVLGHGTEEFRRVINASLWLFGLVAIVSYSLRYDTARGYIGVALPAGLVALLIARMLVRRFLHIDREAGKSCLRVLIIGGPQSAEHLARSLNRQPLAGYLPIANYLPGAPAGTLIAEDLGLPTVGNGTDVESIVSAITKLKPDAVALSGGVQLPPRTIRALGWALNDLNVRLIMAPALTDVAGPRIHTQPVAGLPLIHVSTPKLTGGKRFAKRLFDITVASILIVILLPLMLTISVLVRSSSPGPILYSQERIGIRGRAFKMLKFRSMIADADAKLLDLLNEQGTSETPLFKVKNDPRITSIGKVLRKYSLDELPQLFNVLRGSMSLVGPRPQREGEVALYDDAAHRRLFVSPGMSGLWQVSGRSNLSWQEAIELDLYYVENWSLTQDFVILLKTFKAVVAREGAV